MFSSRESNLPLGVAALDEDNDDEGGPATLPSEAPSQLSSGSSEITPSGLEKCDRQRRRSSSVAREETSERESSSPLALSELPASIDEDSLMARSGSGPVETDLCNTETDLLDTAGVATAAASSFNCRRTTRMSVISSSARDCDVAYRTESPVSRTRTAAN